MQMTLLDIVQDILNDLESDPVNSINDTVEAQSIAQTVKTTFYNIVENKDYPHQYELFQLEALSDTTRPNYMRIPPSIQNVKWIKYNVRKLTDTKDIYTTIKYKTPEEFLDIVNPRDSSATTTLVVTDFSGVKLNIVNNKAPTYFTSFDDNYVVFDSYDSAVDTTLQASKTSSQGKKQIVFTISDTFVPDIPSQMFIYLLNEAKATVFINSKQAVNAKAEQNSNSQRRRLSQDAWKLSNGITYPNYGRK